MLCNANQVNDLRVISQFSEPGGMAAASQDFRPYQQDLSSSRHGLGERGFFETILFPHDIEDCVFECLLEFRNDNLGFSLTLKLCGVSGVRCPSPALRRLRAFVKVFGLTKLLVPYDVARKPSLFCNFYKIFYIRVHHYPDWHISGRLGSARGASSASRKSDRFARRSGKAKRPAIRSLMSYPRYDRRNMPIAHRLPTKTPRMPV
jgi:hypothetical protein